MVRHIFAYHAVADGWEFSAATVTPRRFREHCAALDGEGFRGLRLDVALSAADDYTFGFTVDDGYESLLSVIVPECGRYGWTGTAFIPTRRIASDGAWDLGAWRKHRHLGWSAVRDVVAHGWEIGVHGASHRALTDMPLDEAERELLAARDQIEQRLGIPVRGIAYPFGAASPRIAALARKAGYLHGVTMRPGAVRENADVLLLPRWPVYRMDRPAHLMARLEGPRWVASLERAKVRTIQQFALGTRVRMRGGAR